MRFTPKLVLKLPVVLGRTPQMVPKTGPKVLREIQCMYQP